MRRRGVQIQNPDNIPPHSFSSRYRIVKYFGVSSSHGSWRDPASLYTVVVAKRSGKKKKTTTPAIISHHHHAIICFLSCEKTAATHQPAPGRWSLSRTDHMLAAGEPQ